jgi:WD40 repeat protein
VKVGAMVFSLSLSPCGCFVVAGCHDGSVKLYRLPDWGHTVWSVMTHQRGVLSVSWSPNGRFLASGCYDCTAKILSAGNGATLMILRGHTESVLSVLFAQDGTTVLSGSWDKTVRVWRLFRPMERKARGLMGGVDVHVEDWEMKEVCCEIVGRMKRLWEVEAE